MLNNGNGQFSVGWQMEDSLVTVGEVALADFDADGDMDLYVANDFGRNNLYRNDDGQFRDVAAELDVEDLHEWEEEGVVMKVLRYRAGVFKGKKAMIAAIYGYPKGAQKLPGLVQIHGGGQFADHRRPPDPVAEPFGQRQRDGGASVAVEPDDADVLRVRGGGDDPAGLWHGPGAAPA